MRILITVAPLMYREAMALSIHQWRPHSEVTLASPAALDREARRLMPHLLLRSEDAGHETDPELLADILCWIEVLYTDGLDANVSLDGRLSRLENMSTDDLLAVVDATQKLLPAETKG